MGDIIAGMSTLIWTLAILCIIVVSVKKNARKGNNNRPVNPFYSPVKQLYSDSSSKVPKTVPVKTAKDSAGMILKDDKTNDWLARQLRDEARAMNVLSDMFQLKAEHSNSCDAEFIRRFHESNCDTHGVDDGTRKR